MVSVDTPLATPLLADAIAESNVNITYESGEKEQDETKNATVANEETAEMYELGVEE